MSDLRFKIDAQQWLLQQFPTVIQVGKVYDIHYGEENPNNCRVEIRGIIDGYHVVYRVKSEGGEPWKHYQLSYATYFYFLHKDGIMIERDTF